MSDLRVICADLDARPLFWTEQDERLGYEPDVARLLGYVLGRPVRWVYRSWADFVPALDRGDGDVILCGQGITDHRKQFVDFTEPYAVFDESILTRAGSGIAGREQLRGLRVGAIANSTNIALAETFDGVELVPFEGASDDVLGDMVRALVEGEVDAVVDDDVALVPLADRPDLEIAFTVATRNKWGISVGKGADPLREELNEALRAVSGDDRLAAVWRKWLPQLAYPFAEQPEVS
ncbi:transporter substrate-binding domain-containing protein [Amycolatopsis sp. H6(2020)]|nr:transporter substrate-binding domain-containing protein [Amycolatopsis sp. H6(2020)]